MTRRSHTIQAPSTMGTSAALVTESTARTAGTTIPAARPPRLIAGYRRSKRSILRATPRWYPSWSASTEMICVRR